jgi:hypothetical protein
LDRFIGQKAPGIFGVIAAAQGALGGFLGGALQRLAHFERHQPAEALLFRFEDFAGTSGTPSRRERV